MSFDEFCNAHKLTDRERTVVLYYLIVLRFTENLRRLGVKLVIQEAP